MLALKILLIILLIIMAPVLFAGFLAGVIGIVGNFFLWLFKLCFELGKVFFFLLIVFIVLVLLS